MDRRLCFLFVSFLCLVCAKPIRYEIEDAHVIGAAYKHASKDLGKFSGNGFVNFGSASDDQESMIILTINIPEDGKYLVNMNYAHSSSSESLLAVHINGITQFQSSLPQSSGKWASKTEAVLFRQGLNTIVLKAVSVDPVVSVDYIEVEGSIPLASRGATLPYFELEAENANHNGQKIGPSHDLYQIPTEASGRVAVTITQGQYVEFTLTGSANALTVRFSIPDTPTGSGQKASLDVYVNGAKTTTLAVSSIYSWAYGYYTFTKNPKDGMPHHFYDETRGMFGKTVAAGSKVRIVAVNPIPYTIDLADFYTVPAPYTMPAGYLSVVDKGIVFCQAMLVHMYL